MKRISWLISLLLICSFAIYAQDSYQKEHTLYERERERTTPERRKLSAKYGIKYSDTISSYPTNSMTWGKGFSNGLAKVTVNGKIGFINSHGHITIKPTLKDAGQFSENLAPFENKHGKWGYIDTQGRIIIKPEFNWAISFHEGLAARGKSQKSPINRICHIVRHPVNL